MELPEDIADLPEALAREYLPGKLKDSCFVFDKRTFKWVGFNLFFVGIGIGLGIAALLADLVGTHWLFYGYMAALLVISIVRRKFIHVEEGRFLAKVKESTAET